MDRSRKRKSHTGRNVTIGAAAALLLFAGGMYGLGGGKGLLPGKGDALLPEPTAAVQAAPAEEQPATVEEKTEKILEIVVEESKILYNGLEVSVGELEEHLLKDFDDSAELKLIDDHAIKAGYDEVQSLLDRLGIRPSEG